MTRTQIIVTNNTETNLIIQSFRGSDWNDSNGEPTISIGKVVLANTSNVVVGSIGDPGFGETNHWGWIYLKDDTTNKVLQFFFEKAHKEDPIFSIGLFREDSTDDNPNPQPLDASWYSYSVDSNRDGCCEINQLSRFNIQPDKWMNAVVKDEMYLKNVCLPATHDSATFSLNEEILAPELYDLEWIRPIFNDPLSDEAARAFEEKIIESAIAKEIFRENPLLNDLKNKIFNLAGVISKPFLSESFRRLGQATEESLYQQLLEGIRWIDLRVCFYEDDFYSFHGLLGPSMVDSFKSIQDFLPSRAGEVIFINASHFSFKDPNGNSNDDNGQTDLLHERFINLIETIFGDSLLNCEPGTNLLDMSFGDIRSKTANKDSATVIFLYEDSYYETYLTNIEKTGGKSILWSPNSLFTSIPKSVLSQPDSGTNDLNKLIEDLQTKVDYSQQVLTNQLVSIGWTLTPQTDDILAVVLSIINDNSESLDLSIIPILPFIKMFIDGKATSLRDFAIEANESLPDFIQNNLTKRINKISVDFNNLSEVVDMAILVTESEMP